MGRHSPDRQTALKNFRKDMRYTAAFVKSLPDLPVKSWYLTDDWVCVCVPEEALPVWEQAVREMGYNWPVGSFSGDSIYFDILPLGRTPPPAFSIRIEVSPDNH